MRPTASAAVAAALAAGGAWAAVGGAQAGARTLATLAGASVRISGASTELDAAGHLRVADGARIGLDGASAQLELVRGGGIHLCGPAQVSLTAGGAQALLLSLEQGAVELRYASPVADSVLTPDYRITTVVPPDQLATVSASASLDANGTLCVLNRGSALTVERLYDGVTQSVINGQAFLFPPAGKATAVASCPCTSAAPAAVPIPPGKPGQGAGALFPGQPALTVNGSAPAAAAPPSAAPPPAPKHRSFLSRFFHWLF